MIEDLEEKIHYTFRNKELLKEALIHKSYYEGSKETSPNNEKLEFLGDSVINLIITEYLYKHLSQLNEGELSKFKSHLVSADFLFELANSIPINPYILLGKGEEKNNGRNNKKIVASTFEAIIGAVYLDSNLKKTLSIVVPFFEKFFSKFISREVTINDYKSELQEIMQKHQNTLPIYHILHTFGTPPHITFEAGVFISNQELARGKGKNKRQAEQNAAHNALKKINGLVKLEKLSEVFFVKND